VVYTACMGTLLTFVFFLTLIVFAVYSAVMLWQWKRYSTGRYTTVTYMVVYLVVSGLCILGMATALLSFI
jgi:DNA-binding transcriptional regulator of glucitol operon